MTENEAFIERYSSVTNTTIFNISSLLLTPVEKVVLGLGIKYIPLPKTTYDTLKPSVTDSIKEFHRKLRLSFFFGDTSFIPSNIPKNEKKIPWDPPPAPFDDMLDSYITDITDKSLSAIYKSRSYYTPLDNVLHTTLNRLSKNLTITIKPADKNLGLVVMDTSAYKLMCLAHLQDATTYRPLAVHEYSHNRVYANLRQLLNTHKMLYEDGTRQSTKLATSLLQLSQGNGPRIAPFYVLPKIHKQKPGQPIPGRPIVSSVSTITYHASVYLDKVFQPILKRLPTICTSSQTILLDMQHITTI